MKQFFLQNLQPKFQSMRKNPRFQTCKMLYLGCFLAGFILFFILGKDFLNDISLLNVNALREIRDSTIDKGAFMQYIFLRRMLLLAAGVLAWWWGFGKLYVYGVWACFGFAMGACMYTCLLRYALKGLFLWFFMYFPHVLFYAVALFCGMILSNGVNRSKADKLKFLWQNSLWVFLLLILLGIGIYTESHMNVSMFQDFLQYF